MHVQAALARIEGKSVSDFPLDTLHAVLERGAGMADEPRSQDAQRDICAGFLSDTLPTLTSLLLSSVGQTLASDDTPDDALHLTSIALCTHNNPHVTLSQSHVLILLAHALFGTFARESSDYTFTNWMSFRDGHSAQAAVAFKLVSVIHGLVCLTTGRVEGISGGLELVRTVAQRVTTLPEGLALPPFSVMDDGTIEDAVGLLQADFANRCVCVCVCVSQEATNVLWRPSST
jgi:hypothetical protein